MKRHLRRLRWVLVPWPLMGSVKFLGEEWKVVIWWPDVPRLEDAANLLAIGRAQVVRERPEDHLALYYRGKWLI